MLYIWYFLFARKLKSVLRYNIHKIIIKMSGYPPLTYFKAPDRMKGQKFMYKDKIVIWNGKILLCEHNLQKSRCKECGGSSICEHNKIKSKCKECGGASICEHNKIKSKCKECGGASICEHNKIKSQCKECGGSSICEHNKIKSRCKECGGGSICEHNKIKSTCKECGGSQICEHNRRKSGCKECGGSQICEHNKIKSQCKECGGGSICEHNKIKSTCKECGGGSICEHNKIKSKCKECGGGSLCKHNKQKPQCKECGGSQLCKNQWCETRKQSKYEGYCMPCFVNNPDNRDKPAMRNYKTKEREVVNSIRKVYPDFTWVADKKVADGCSRRRPDLLLDLGTHIVIIEIDENKHDSYDCSCENMRVMEISRDVGHRPIVFIRFNPDGYTSSQTGKKISSCWRLNKLGVMSIVKTKQHEWDERMNTLMLQIQYWNDNPPTKMIETVQLYY